MRLRRFFEGQRLRHHRLHLPAAHEGQHVGELVSRHARHGEHRLILEEELRRVERHEIAGELPDHHPAAGGAVVCAITNAPARRASCTACSPTPPPAPVTSTLSPILTWPTSRIPFSAVPMAHAAIAASPSVT